MGSSGNPFFMPFCKLGVYKIEVFQNILKLFFDDPFARYQKIFENILVVPKIFVSLSHL